MSTYYEYKDVKVMMAHKLMTMEGWKVYGYKENNSDAMTDYYDPAYWDGIATKNGYVLVVDNSRKTEAQEVKRYNHSNCIIDSKTNETIKKLENMTSDRGASEQEEETAKAKIELLKSKNKENNSKVPEYEVVGIIPAHEANPPRCNWHIEKDGVIILKGSGLLKYSSVDSYFSYDHYKKSYDLYKKSPSDWIKDNANGLYNRGYCNSMEKALEEATQNIKSIEKDALLIDEFNSFIQKLDSTCGGILGTGDLVTYEKVIVTEYKTENKTVDTVTGSIKDGQYFILKTGFNYGRNKGYVYCIHEIGEEGKKYFTAYKLNGKLTKECRGMAEQSNTWYLGTEDRLTKWIDKGSISWCNIEEVKTPYEVEKVVKKVLKSETETAATQPKTTATETDQEETHTTELNNLHYIITEDTDTRDNSVIYLVKVIEKLSRDEYLVVNKNIQLLGGYYSKFKHSFIFKTDPTELLNGSIKQSEVDAEAEPQSNKEEQTVTQQPQTEVKKSIDFEIEQSQHTQTKQPIWLVKIKSTLSKDDFAEIKRKLAILKGFYSSYSKGFIFNYDPSEKLKISA